ncbi:MAG: hypothetical protein HZC10_01655 [Nitrospirae bacterium]|nr:hypothetical protein [Nitrospirota bacterium]
MFYSYLQVLNPVLGLMINVIVQVICSRFIQRLGLLKTVFLGFFVGMLSVLMIELYIFFATSAHFTDFFMMFAANFIAYASLGYCYFHFINLGETARRIRILGEIYDSKDGLSLEEILQRYNAKEIVEKRISRLLNNGQVILKNGRYYIGNPIMLMINRIIVAMKLMLLGKRSEFDQ